MLNVDPAKIQALQDGQCECGRIDDLTWSIDRNGDAWTVTLSAPYMTAHPDGNYDAETFGCPLVAAGAVNGIRRSRLIPVL